MKRKDRKHLPLAWESRWKVGRTFPRWRGTVCQAPRTDACELVEQVLNASRAAPPVLMISAFREMGLQLQSERVSVCGLVPIQ